ncbi:MAG TPA: DUF4347 domain-containing protein, partial [Coleofasciculaceae cyanobacterium]
MTLTAIAGISHACSFNTNSLVDLSLNTSPGYSQNILVVIDPAVENWTDLASGVVEGANVSVLQADQDGITQITALLQTYPAIHSLHVIAHGTPGKLNLGNAQLSLETLDRHAWDIQTWLASSPAVPQILLYGCNVAAGDAGTEFLKQLQLLTGATIHASTAKVGSPSLGGSWNLNVTLGSSHPVLALTAATQATYHGVFVPENLLANPGAETGDMSGWTIINGGGSGWMAGANGSYEGANSFTTSFDLTQRSQTIDLLAKGYSAANLDQAPTINVAEWFRGSGPNVADTYYLKVELRDANQQVITSWDSGTLTANANWQQLTHAFTNYGAGVRYIYWEDGGDDAEYWAGNYGTQLDAASLTIDAPTVPANQAPTDLGLSASALDENVPANTAIGTFTTTDPDANNTFTYSLVAGTGDTDNAAFTIVGNQLKINASPDYETKPSYTVRVRTTDQGGLSTEKALTIAVNDLPEAPPAPLELRVDLSDSGTNPTGNWNTIPGNGTFNALKDFNSGAATGVNLTIQNVSSEAGSNQWFAGSINWIDNSAGSDNFFGNTTPLVARFAGLTPGKQYKIEVVSATNAGGVSSDVQVQGSFASRSSDGQGGTGNDWNGNIGLQRWLIWDTVTASPSGEILVTSAPGAGSPLSVLNAIHITEAVPNTPPTIPAGQSFSITENSAAGTVVGTVAAKDAEGNTLQGWQITAGNTDVDQDGKAAFAMNAATGQITVNDADDLNFGSSPTFNLQTTVSDGTTTSAAQTVTVNLTQIPQPGNLAPTGINLSN